MHKFYKPFFWIILVTLLQPLVTLGQQLAFPGAEGFGRFTSGGRGGAVYEVTNTNDSGPGSLREGINRTGARTIVFRVSGTIHLDSELKIRNGNLTIAGQTAPGDGIAIKGNAVVVDADNIIIRYIRFRPGDISGGEPDAIWGRNRKNIIIDHCSMSWAVDETSSFYDNENFTMQWCLLSESLYESQHEKGRHGYGGIWGGQGATFHHNILAHHSSRNPRFNGSRYSGEPDLEIVDYRNNVIYNWGGNSAYGGENGNHNIVANYYKAGPATSGDKRFRILDASSVNDSDPLLGRWHIEDNFVEGFPEVTADNWNGGVQRLDAAELQEVRYEEPFPFAPVTTQTAEEAYASVLANAGAILPKRDKVDTRIVQEIESGTVNFGGVYGEMKGIIDSQEQVGGWPELFAAPAPEDIDHDGMPDTWEIEKGLDPEDPEDGAQLGEDGYTNLENYINSLNGFIENFLKYPTSIVAEGKSSSTINLAWENNEEGDYETVVERSTDKNTFSLVETLPAGTAEFLDEGLEAGTEYYYRLHVKANEGTSVFSTIVSAATITLPDKVSEPIPMNNATSVLPDVVDFSWIGDASTYNFYIGSSMEDLESVGRNLDELSFTMSDLSETTEYFWRVDAVAESGEEIMGDTWSFTTSGVTEVPKSSFEDATFSLFPNPFSEKVMLRFKLQKGGSSKFSFFDIHGRLVHSMSNGMLGAGVHVIDLDSKDMPELPEGMYLCVLEVSGQKREARRFVYVK